MIKLLWWLLSKLYKRDFAQQSSERQTKQTKKNLLYLSWLNTTKSYEYNKTKGTNKKKRIKRKSCNEEPEVSLGNWDVLQQFFLNPHIKT